MKATVFVLLVSVGLSAQELSYRWIDVDGIKIFYREAGRRDRPAILFLHGTPTSSLMYQDMIQRLAGDFYCIAPDYPAHGYSDTPDPASYPYTFENITRTIDSFTVRLDLDRFALFIQDYRSPIGFRLAVKHPEKITAWIVQNGNAYLEGFPLAQNPDGVLWTYWKTKNPEYEKKWTATYRGVKSPTADTWKYGEGVNPDRRMVDWAVMQKPGTADIFLNLWYDYRTNVESYPVWQSYLRKFQPPMLIVWGEKDRFFIADGARAYLKDVPKAELHLLSGGHWAATEDNVSEIATLIRQFFEKHGIR
jgi:pimeloyl-ACP methyl ester carboxylesterase